MIKNNCTWTQEDDWDNSGVYNTSCGESFVIAEETPEMNGIKFCCFCGGHLVQVLFESD